MQPRHRATAVIKKDHKLLLIHRHNKGQEYWTVPGGGLEEGEDPKEAVIREAQEELGQEIVSATPAFTYEEDHTTGKRTNYVFRCTIPGGELKVGGPELDRTTADNTYERTWVEMNLLADLPLRPIEIKPHLLKYLNEN